MAHLIVIGRWASFQILLKIPLKIRYQRWSTLPLMIKQLLRRKKCWQPSILTDAKLLHRSERHFFPLPQLGSLIKPDVYTTNSFVRRDEMNLHRCGGWLRGAQTPRVVRSHRKEGFWFARENEGNFHFPQIDSMASVDRMFWCHMCANPRYCGTHLHKQQQTII